VNFCRKFTGSQKSQISGDGVNSQRIYGPTRIFDSRDGVFLLQQHAER